MLKFTSKASTSIETKLTLTLPFELRQKARLHTKLDSGEEAGLFLPRGDVLRDGNQLLADSGEVVTIISANEDVSTIYSDDAYLLMRASYHLGNRHVLLEIKSNYVRYQFDHVLNKMVEHLHLKVTQESAPFEPEAGAYSHGNSHSHSHHTHSHD